MNGNQNKQPDQQNPKQRDQAQQQNPQKHNNPQQPGQAAERDQPHKR